MEKRDNSQSVVTVADCWEEAISQYPEGLSWLVGKYADELSFPHGFYRHLKGAFSWAALLAWKVPYLDLASRESLLNFIGPRFMLCLWAKKLFASLDETQMRGISVKDWPNRPNKDYFGLMGTSALEIALKVTLRVLDDSSLTGEAFHVHSHCQIWPCPEKAIAEWVCRTKDRMGVMVPSKWSANDLMDQIYWMHVQMDSEYNEYLETNLPAITDGKGLAVIDPEVKPEDWHSADFRSVRLKGQEWTFTKNQSKVIKVLWEAKRSGEGALSESEILNRANLNTDRLVDVFKVKNKVLHGIMGIIGTIGAARPKRSRRVSLSLCGLRLERERSVRLRDWASLGGVQRPSMLVAPMRQTPDAKRRNPYPFVPTIP